ncbi:hypothetical protein [Ruminococcus sp. HUN007]|uniref:hypothetical protein n=1 Tax=Ruminococcus sp. HUN007 TaxID=1514668 RepID=UPI000AECB04E|nr:hypothetical protein [Ruminococcus sp. HUN007]
MSFRQLPHIKRSGEQLSTFQLKIVEILKSREISEALASSLSLHKPMMTDKLLFRKTGA